MAACCAGDASGSGARMSSAARATTVRWRAHGEQFQIARALLDVDDQQHSFMMRVNGSKKLPIRGAPALAARNIPSTLTSTLADIASLFLLTHDPHDLGRGEAAEISSDKRAIAPVVLECVQQFIAYNSDDACGLG